MCSFLKRPWAVTRICPRVPTSRTQRLRFPGSWGGAREKRKRKGVYLDSQNYSLKIILGFKSNSSSFLSFYSSNILMNKIFVEDMAEEERKKSWVYNRLRDLDNRSIQMKEKCGCGWTSFKNQLSGEFSTLSWTPPETCPLLSFSLEVVLGHISKSKETRKGEECPNISFKEKKERECSGTLPMSP